MRVLELELSRALPEVAAVGASGRRYRRALALVRLHDRPLGVVDLALDEHGLPPSSVAARVWDALGAEIDAHLSADGLPPCSALGPDGLPAKSAPACLRRRRLSLASAPPASVIVASRDGAETLGACLDSLLTLEYPSVEVIVVDNAPRTEATRDLVQERYAGAATPVRYVREDRPGLALAHNRGLAEAAGAIVAFTDDDVIVDRHWLLELVRGFASPRVACVTGMIFPAELETPPQLWLEQYGGFAKGFEDRVFDLADNRPADVLFPYTAGTMGSGASMAFRAEVLRRLGGFDPATGAGTAARGGDDLAAFFDVVAAGHAVAYAPAALLYHRHRGDLESLRRQAFEYGVGLTAYLTRAVMAEPTRMLGIAPLAPRGLMRVLSPGSPKNAGKRPDFPRELTRLERRGMLLGPLAYVRARRESRLAGSARSGLVASSPARMP